ncbi:MAG: asparagine synthase (glutamine-hydrolyzing), partial [Candidatus Aenigmarchaeota archaeon]|nr:asparagine synthase (glutamine-hydrolyzing) [Candidatus Aenigmarchaeota archaeon]
THRGPDQDGAYSDEYVALAHKRLSIIDLSENGRQPMADSTGDYVIVYNGEVFNYGELKKELAGKGHRFVSNTDTEVILNAYIEWGRNCVERFNGQFAFCIYDKKKKELFLARDRLGIKPLYFFSEGSRFIFGSELKVILKAGIEKEIDEKALNHYLIFGYTPSESSILKNVYKLLPGHYLVYDIEKKRIAEKSKYWEISFSDKIHSEEEAKETLYGLLDSSVKRRLIADVPVGAFLSGGVDSSIIVYLMRKYVKDLKTFSIKFDHDEFNESKWARLVADRLNTDHHEIEFNAVDLKKLIPDLVYLFDEPFGDSSMIPTYLVSKVAREQVKVCLSGTGADELFGGYHRYREFSQLRKL